MSVQWREMLTLVSLSLEENAIANIYVNGNARVRSKAVTDFKVIASHCRKL